MTRARRVGYAALVLFLLLDLAIVGLVIAHKRGNAKADTKAVVTPTGSATSSSTTTAPAAGPTLTAALLSVVDAKTAWSGTKGTCGKGGATVARTANAGATWVSTKAQPYAALSRLDATSGQAAFVVGADASCSVAVRNTTTGGDTWRSPTTVSASWALDVADRTLLHSTKGTTSTPCGTVRVTAFARVSDTAASVVCDDDSTRATIDAGRTWTPGPSLASVTGLGDVVGYAVAGSGVGARLVVAASATGCSGVQVLTSAAGRAFAPAACVAPVRGSTPSVALAQQGDSVGTLWLLAGTELWHASGGLTAWSKAS